MYLAAGGRLTDRCLFPLTAMSSVSHLVQVTLKREKKKGKACTWQLGVGFHMPLPFHSDVVIITSDLRDLEETKKKGMYLAAEGRLPQVSSLPQQCAAILGWVACATAVCRP